MRLLIRRLDALIRRAGGVFEFTDHADCLFRLQRGQARRPIRLSDGTQVEPGDPVLVLHLWNEHVPPMGPLGADLVWAVRVRRMLASSLCWLASWLEQNGGERTARALFGVTVLVPANGANDGKRLLARLGFDVRPHRGRLGRFGAFWENLYAWGLMWTFNAASLRRRNLLSVRRAEIWISTRLLLDRYGPKGMER